MRHYRKIIHIAGMLFIPLVNLFAESNESIFEHLTEDDGLTQNTIISICQDSLGFVWFGTYTGLNRYDGYSIKTYTNNPSDTNSLCNNVIEDMIVTHDGKLWFATDDGLCSYEHATEKFTRYRHDPEKDNGPHHNKIRTLCQLDSTHLLIGTYGGGLYNMDLTKSEIPKRFRYDSKKPNSISHNTILCIYKDRNKNIWVGTEKELNLYQSDGTFLRFSNIPHDSTSLSDDVVNSIYDDQNGNLWIGTWGKGLNCLRGGYYKGRNIKFKHYYNILGDSTSLSHNSIKDIKEDFSGRLWVATWGGGLNIYDDKSDSFTRYTEKFRQQYSLSDNMVNALLKDKTGIFWVGTYGGVNKTYKRYFNCRSIDPLDPTTLYFKDINAVFVDTTRGHDIVWLGNLTRGLGRWDRDRSKEGPANMRYYTPNDSSGLPDGRINAIFRDSEGRVWVGTGKGLSWLSDTKIDGKNHTFNNYFASDSAGKLGCRDVYTIYEDSKHFLWIGTFAGGLYRLDLNNKLNLNPASAHFDSFKNNPDSSTTISDNTIRSIFEDSHDSSLWFGTQWGGINRFDRTMEHFSHNSTDQKITTSISNNYVRCIFNDYNKNLWCGTANGLNKLMDTTKLTFLRIRNSQISLKDNSGGNNIFGILQDRLGNFWMSTDIGIVKYIPTDTAFTIYGKNDGLQGKAFVDNAYGMGCSGLMYFGRREGLVIFLPDSIRRDKPIPPLVPLITELFINNKPITVDQTEGNPLTKSILLTDTLRLSDQENGLRFKISALNFRAPEYIRYRYRLDGHDTSWQWLGLTKNEIYYDDLPDGSYTLTIEAKNRDGLAAARNFSFTIKTPWFRKDFAISVIFVFAVFFIIILILIMKYWYTKNCTRLQDENKNLSARSAKLESVNGDLEARTANLEKAIRRLDATFDLAVKFIGFDSIDGRSKKAVDQISDLFESKTAYYLAADTGSQSKVRMKYCSPDEFKNDLHETFDPKRPMDVYKAKPLDNDVHLEIPVQGGGTDLLEGYVIVFRSGTGTKADEFSESDRQCIENMAKAVIQKITAIGNRT